MPDARTSGRGLAIGLGASAIVVIAAALGHAGVRGDFATDGAALLANPWGVATLAEVYVGFMLFSGWIWTRERRAASAAIWIAGLLLIGALVSGAYVLRAAATSRGDAKRFWLGERPIT